MKRREQLAALIAFLLGAPLVFVYATAMMDGDTRRRETVFRAVLGNERFDELMAGEGGFPHYLGSSLSAPEIELQDREGQPWRLADHRGKVVVLNFWSITCPPCLEELPSLELLAHLAERWGDVEVVAVSADEGWSAVSSGSMKWDASTATKGSVPSTIPSSPCWRSIRPTATTRR